MQNLNEIYVKKQKNKYENSKTNINSNQLNETII